MPDDQDQAQPFDLGSALARIGNIPTQGQLGQAAQDEGAAYRGRLAQEQPQAPENPTFNGAMIEPITPLSPQSQPPYDYSAANLESGRNISRQSFVDSYNKQAAAEPRVDPLNRIASSLAGRPVTPYNANPSNYRQLTPSEEAEKYRSEQEAYASLAAQGIAGLPLAKYAPGPNQLQAIIGTKAPETAKSIDPLGYYSHALEAAKTLPQAKGTPEQMLAQLKKAGVKDAELQATGMPQFLEGKPSITRDELVQHLEENRVDLNAAKYGGRDEYTKRDQAFSAQLNELNQEMYDLLGGQSGPEEFARMQELRNEIRITRAEQLENLQRLPKSPNWNTYSLDPDNPTYRETVLHLPEAETKFGVFNDNGYQVLPRLFDTRQEAYEARTQMSLDGRANVKEAPPPPQFQSGHFPEPNITGHLMTSMVEDNTGRKVFNVDQIQSDWGQKLREGGVLDEAKIADLERQHKEATAAADSADIAGASRYANTQIRDWHAHAVRLANSGDQEALSHAINYDKALQEEARLEAELKIAKASGMPGHPLVNTTDQWTNTTLRQALRQAVESGADAISIPHGDTVLSYNPEGRAGPNGMRGFYGRSTKEGIVPKNLRKILKTYDPGHSGGQHVEQLVTPTRGAANRGSLPISDGGSDFGFTVFPLTDKIKKSVMEEGQPLFKRGGSVRKAFAVGGSISDKTYALLHKIKRQDGGAATPSDNAPPQDERDIPTIDPAPLIPKAVSDLAPDLSRNVAGTPTYGGGINPFESKQVQNWEPLLYGIPYLGFTKMAQQLPSVARTINETEEGMRVPGMMQGIYDKVSNLPSNASEIVSGMWNNRWPSSSERVEAAYEGERTKNSELYKLDPQGYLEEVAEHVRYKPTNPGEAIQKDEYMRGVPLGIQDKVYRDILHENGGPGAFETATSPSQKPKNTDRLGPGGFETQVVPSRARGGAISDKTNTLLAKLKAQKSA